MIYVLIDLAIRRELLIFVTLIENSFLTGSFY